MAYSDDFKEEVREHSDLVTVISQYVSLKRTGNRYWGLCPFHREKTPSFSVTPESGMYHCFGCHASGDVFKFVMEMEHVDFPEALKLLADRAGLKVPETASEGAYSKKKREDIERFAALNKAAGRFFHQRLKESPEALRYLTDRGLYPKTIREFGIGYAPDDWGELKAHLLSEGFSEADMLTVGLLSKNQETGNTYDRYRGRIMFPIIDLKKRVIGFGGRILGAGEPKYLNSQESVIFNKSQNLFNLNFAKGHSELLVVEGYMDVISVFQSGIQNVVATLGTALNAEHARVLKRHVKEVILCYDSDQAGQKAALRAIDVLTNAGLGGVRILKQSAYKDPDEYIKNLGADRFREEMKNAKPWPLFKIDCLREQYDIEDTREKVLFANEAAKVFAGISNAIEQETMVRRVAQETGISVSSFMSEIGKIDRSSISKSVFRPPVRPVQKEAAEETAALSPKQLKGERMLLYIMASDPGVAKKVFETFTPSDFELPVHQRLGEYIQKAGKDGKAVHAPGLLDEFPEDAHKEITAVFQCEAPFDDNEAAAFDLVNTLRNEKQLKAIQKNIEEGNVSALNRIFQKKKEDLNQ